MRLGVPVTVSAMVVECELRASVFAASRLQIVHHLTRYDSGVEREETNAASAVFAPPAAAN